MADTREDLRAAASGISLVIWAQALVLVLIAFGFVRYYISDSLDPEDLPTFYEVTAWVVLGLGGASQVLTAVGAFRIGRVRAARGLALVVASAAFVLLALSLVRVVLVGSGLAAEWGAEGIELYYEISGWLAIGTGVALQTALVLAVDKLGGAARATLVIALAAIGLDLLIPAAANLAAPSLGLAMWIAALFSGGAASVAIIVFVIPARSACLRASGGAPVGTDAYGEAPTEDLDTGATRESWLAYSRGLSIYEGAILARVVVHVTGVVLLLLVAATGTNPSSGIGTSVALSVLSMLAALVMIVGLFVAGSARTHARGLTLAAAMVGLVGITLDGVSLSHLLDLADGARGGWGAVDSLRILAVVAPIVGVASPLLFLGGLGVASGALQHPEGQQRAAAAGMLIVVTLVGFLVTSFVKPRGVVGLILMLGLLALAITALVSYVRALRSVRRRVAWFTHGSGAASSRASGLSPPSVDASSGRPDA